MPAQPEPLRGEIWDVRFPGFGEHPAAVMSIDALNTRLGHAVVVPITGTAGPEQTHILLATDAGPTRYDQSYADITALQSIDRNRFRRRRGLLPRSELAHIEAQLRPYLGL